MDPIKPPAQWWQDPFGWPWWCRYLLGIALLGLIVAAPFAVEAYVAPRRQTLWYSLAAAYGFLTFLLAMALMREVACFGAIALILGAIGYAVAGLPASVAIIIGAVIIASAASKPKT